MAAKSVERTKSDLISLLDRLTAARYGLSNEQRKAAITRTAELVTSELPGVAKVGIEAALAWDKLGLDRDKMVLEALLESQGGGRNRGVVVNNNVLQVSERERTEIVAELLERARGRLAVQANQGNGAAH